MTPAAAPLAALAGVWVGSALWVHLRGRERLSFMRQVADHSTFLAPYNAFVYLFSAVPTRPMLRAEEFPELDHLRAHWEEIRDEARALLRDGHIRKAARHDDLAFNSFYKRDWRRFYLKWYGDIMPSARSLCPRTIELLAATPSVHAAMFAVLAPHSHLVRHRDPFAGSLRYHLGLQTPNDDTCRIFIDGEPLPLARRRGHAVRRDLHPSRREPHRQPPHHPLLRRRAPDARARRHRHQSLRDPARDASDGGRQHGRGSGGRRQPRLRAAVRDSRAS